MIPNTRLLTSDSVQGEDSFCEHENHFTMSARSYFGLSASASVDEVYFDLEATGLERPAIIQFSAVGPASMGEFNKYVTPSKAISASAAQLTGISYSGGVMRVDGRRVNHVSLHECLEDFLDYLGNHKVVLVAHNGHRFDGPLLIKSAVACGLSARMREKVTGFRDTLHMFRAFYPQLKGTRDRPYSQESLVKTVLKESGEDSHDALEDARALKRLVEHASPSAEFKRKYLRNWNFVQQNVANLQ